MSAVAAGASYTYRVRSIRDGERSGPSETAVIELPEDYSPPVSTSPVISGIVEVGPEKGGKGDNGEDPPDTFLPGQVIDPGQVPPGNVVVRAEEETPVLLVANTGQTQGSSDTLDSTFTKRAQAFTTGASIAGYSVSSVGIRFTDIDDTSTAGSELTATINEDSNSSPGDVLCTLDDPVSYAADSVNSYTAPSSGCSLAASTTYYVVLERANNNTDAIEWQRTESTAEDSGSARGWTIATGHYNYLKVLSKWLDASQALMMEVRGAAEAVPTSPRRAGPMS